MVILAVVNSVIGIFYYFKVVFAMYTKDSAEVTVSIKPAYAFVIGLCVLLLLLTGIFPSVISLLAVSRLFRKTTLVYFTRLR